MASQLKMCPGSMFPMSNFMKIYIICIWIHLNFWINFSIGKHLGITYSISRSRIALWQLHQMEEFIHRFHWLTSRWVTSAWKEDFHRWPYLPQIRMCEAFYLAGMLPFKVPCTPAGCVELLQRSGVEVAGTNVVVLGRRKIVIFKHGELPGLLVGFISLAGPISWACQCHRSFNRWMPPWRCVILAPKTWCRTWKMQTSSCAEMIQLQQKSVENPAYISPWTMAWNCCWQYCIESLRSVIWMSTGRSLPQLERRNMFATALCDSNDRWHSWQRLVLPCHTWDVKSKVASGWSQDVLWLMLVSMQQLGTSRRRLYFRGDLKTRVFSQHRLLSLGIQFPLFLLLSSTLSLTTGGAGQTAQLCRVLEELPVP